MFTSRTSYISRAFLTCACIEKVRVRTASGWSAFTPTMQFVAKDGASASYNAAASTSSPVAPAALLSNAPSTNAAAASIASDVPVIVIALSAAGVLVLAVGLTVVLVLVIRARGCAGSAGSGDRCRAFSPFKVARFGKLRRDDSGGKGSRGLPADPNNNNNNSNGKGNGCNGAMAAQNHQCAPPVAAGGASTPVSQIHRNQPGMPCFRVLEKL